MFAMNRFAIGAAALALALALLGPRTAAPQATPSGAPGSAGPVDPAAIDDLVVANHILADRGIIDAFGHISMRHPGNPNRYLMSRSQAPALVKADDIMEFDLDSNAIDRRGRGIFLERYIHGEVYRARPDVMAVVHSHSTGVIPFSVTKVPLRPIFHTGSFLWKGVPVFEIRDAGGATNMLVSSSKLGKALADVLGDKPVALMRGHGDVVVGANVMEVVSRTIYTEDNARMQAIAIQLGGPIAFISPEEGALRDQDPGDPRRSWELWKAQAGAKAR
jgi:ribulose-5-phosphate 4-epimerase/fuculose-1-phosphate aldolase